MFGPYSDVPLFFDKKTDSISLTGEFPQSRREKRRTGVEWDRYNDLLSEAEAERLAARLPQSPSLVSLAWARTQAWLGELECRLRSTAFRQPCAEPIG